MFCFNSARPAPAEWGRLGAVARWGFLRGRGIIEQIDSLHFVATSHKDGAFRLFDLVLDELSCASLRVAAIKLFAISVLETPPLLPSSVIGSPRKCTRSPMPPPIYLFIAAASLWLKIKVRGFAPLVQMLYLAI